MIIHEYSWIMRPQCCLGFVGPALRLIFQQLFPYSIMCTKPDSDCCTDSTKYYPVHSYVLVLDSVSQYIQVIFIFHNITWFWLKYFEHRWRDLMWQWGWNVGVSSVIEHWQKLMLGRKGDGGEGGRWGEREVMWFYSERLHFCLTALSFSSSARSWSPQSMG